MHLFDEKTFIECCKRLVSKQVRSMQRMLSDNIETLLRMCEIGQWGVVKRKGCVYFRCSSRFLTLPSVEGSILSGCILYYP